MRFVVYGAGAVGGVLGGHLALKNHDVLLICREAHAKTIGEQDGLRMKSATGEYFAHLKADTSARADHFDKGTCVFLTPKSNHTGACVAELARCAPRETPVVSFQNGIVNEELISKEFENVFGGVCRMTCSFLQPGQVSFRQLGRLVVGKYPKGAHPYARKLAKILDGSGFDVSVSNNIMSDKWLKLVINLQSTFHALIDGRDHESVEFVRLKVGVLEEAKRVLSAAGIAAASCDGKDPSIDEMISELGKPRAPRTPPSVRVHNSTWQNLYLKRGEVENAYFHGPVIDLARRHGVDVPCNEAALELVTNCCNERGDPGTLRATEVLARIRKRSAGN